jgi:WD40 repeat protein
MKCELRGRGIGELIRDYAEAARLADERGLDEALRRRLGAYQHFVGKQRHRVGPHPSALLPVAHAQPLDCPVRADASERERAHKLTRPWFRRLHSPETDYNPALLATIIVGQAVKTMSVFPRGGRQHVLAATGKLLCLYDLTTQEQVRQLEGHDREVRVVAVIGEDRVVSGCGDGTLRVWDLDSGACMRNLRGHTDRVTAVAVTGEGRAVSGSDDRTLRVWDLDRGECLSTLRGHSGEVRTVAAISTGRAVSGSVDGSLRRYGRGF